MPGGFNNGRTQLENLFNSPYHTRVISFMLQERNAKPMTIAIISSKSDVPASTVENVLNKLFALGVVQVTKRLTESKRILRYYEVNNASPVVRALIALCAALDNQVEIHATAMEITGHAR